MPGPCPLPAGSWVRPGLTPECRQRSPAACLITSPASKRSVDSHVLEDPSSTYAKSNQSVLRAWPSGIGSALPPPVGGSRSGHRACLAQSGGRGAHAPRPPTPPDIRVSYPAVPLGVVALDTSAPRLDSPPTPTVLAAPLWAQIGFRPLRLPRGAPRQPVLVRHAFLRLHARRVIRVCCLHQEVQPFPARPGPVLWRLLTPPRPSNAIADAVVRINRTGPEASQGKPCLFPAVPAGCTPAASG